MEFDEMKKIWDTQNNEPLYAINEKALHSRILSKMKKGYRISNASELIGIFAYGFTGCFIITIGKGWDNSQLLLYILSAWMLACSLYILAGRVRRLRGKQQFDRSMRGDLLHAISIASYQVNLSRLMRWNILPIGLLTVLSLLASGKSPWPALAVLAFFGLAGYASGWEHRIYKNKKRELELLQQKLDSGDR